MPFAIHGYSTIPTATVAPAAIDPISLRAARRRFPGVDPLYTLQVAVWGDFESGELSLE